jgi:hypothetical protein
MKLPPIFKPFEDCTRKHVSIVTWNISAPENMQEIIVHLEKARSVSLYVGYSKTTHNLELLLKLMLQYRRIGCEVYGIPNCHAKFWKVGHKLWIGSANFCAPSLTNIMVETKSMEANDLFYTIVERAQNINETTKLKLLRQIYTKEELFHCIF